MATKFSPCKGSYVLNQFPSNVMFGMNGFHVSISQWSDTGPSWPSCFFQRVELENIVGKKRKCWSPAYSPLPDMFSKAFFQGV